MVGAQATSKITANIKIAYIAWCIYIALRDYLKTLVDGRLCLTRHLKGIRKNWRIMQTGENSIIEARILYHSNSWTQFCCKMWWDSLVWNQYIHPIDAQVKFYKYRFPFLFLRGVLKATLITLCFIRLISTITILRKLGNLLMTYEHWKIIQNTTLPKIIDQPPNLNVKNWMHS